MFIKNAAMFPAKTFLLLFAIVALASCETDIATVNLVGGAHNRPLESGKDVELIYSDSAQVKVKIFAPQLDGYEGDEPRKVLPKGVKVEFYDEAMRVKTKLTADYGIKYENQKRVEVRNNVVVINEKGEQLNTEHLIWDEVTQKIYTDKFVRITTAEEVIYGDGLEANQDFTQYKITNIKGTITKEDIE
jgi:LPS export ABC transporter protein LptC